MPNQIDARGPRFGAAITVVVLGFAFLNVGTPVAAVLLAIQALAFGLGAVVGPQAQPYGLVYARAVAPRLAPPAEFEAPEPPRFAQAVGLAFVLAALVGVGIGSAGLTTVAIGFALAASFLNAAFGLCLGCEVYLLLRRLQNN